MVANQSSVIRNSPGNSDDENDNAQPVFGPKIPGLLRIFNYPEETQKRMIAVANFEEV